MKNKSHQWSQSAWNRPLPFSHIHACLEDKIPRSQA